MENDLNLSYLYEMAGDDPEQIRELVLDILFHLEETEKNMNGYIENESLNEIALAAHKLKSSLQIVGADFLAGRFYELEILAKKSSMIKEILPLYETVISLSHECRQKLQEAIEELH